MDRRIRVKCPDCAASIELRVDLEELLDVTCPRCQHLFTAKVPPPVLEIAPVEVEPVPEEPPVRRTRVVRPKSAGPKSSNPLPPSVPAPPPVDSNWFDPVPPYDSSLQVSFATHVKAVLIATGSIISLGLLVMVGFMITSAVSNIKFSTASDTTETNPTAATEPLALGPLTTAPTDATPELSTESTTELTSLAGSAPLATSTSLPEVTTTNSVIDPTPGAAESMPAGGSSKPKKNVIAEKIVSLANQIADATKDSDNEFILDRTHPKLIQLAGGRNKMLEILNKALEPMKTQGISIADYTVSNDIVVRQVGQKIFAVLPTTLELRYPNRTLRTEGFLLAVSEDAGQTYSFIDGAGAAKNRSVLKQIIPDLPDDLALPPSGTPREVPQ